MQLFINVQLTSLNERILISILRLKLEVQKVCFINNDINNTNTYYIYNAPDTNNTTYTLTFKITRNTNN